jgi:hypothetical protein
VVWPGPVAIGITIPTTDRRSESSATRSSRSLSVRYIPVSPPPSFSQAWPSACLPMFALAPQLFLGQHSCPATTSDSNAGPRQHSYLLSIQSHRGPCFFTVLRHNERCFNLSSMTRSLIQTVRLMTAVVLHCRNYSQTPVWHSAMSPGAVCDGRVSTADLFKARSDSKRLFHGGVRYRRSGHTAKSARGFHTDSSELKRRYELRSMTIQLDGAGKP